MISSTPGTAAESGTLVVPAGVYAGMNARIDHSPVTWAMRPEMAAHQDVQIALNGPMRDAAGILNAHDAVDQLRDAAGGITWELQELLDRLEGRQLMDNSGRG